MSEDGRRSAEKAALDRVMGSTKRLRAKGRPTPGRGSDRDPKLVADLVDEVVVEGGWALDVSLGSLAVGWGEMVGDKVAEHCVPESFKDGELTVRADSTAWATEIRLLSGQLLEAVARAVGQGVVTDIRVLGPARAQRRGRYVVRR
jgi:predicted nucleic acid-binding Zn ribbon protein